MQSKHGIGIAGEIRKRAIRQACMESNSSIGPDIDSKERRYRRPCVWSEHLKSVTSQTREKKRLFS